MLLLVAAFLLFADPGQVFYRSKTAPSERLIRHTERYQINNDKGESADVELLSDAATRSIYWYRRLFTEVCLTGECRPIDIGIYWTFDGKYQGVEVFGENLTKTDHSDFSDFDYRKLESVMRDEWSPLREFEFDELVDEKKEGVDATTGATKKVISDASVKDAVYTTYTMWHLTHVGEGEQLALLTYRYLNENPEVLSAFVEDDTHRYLSFLIDGITSGSLAVSPGLVSVILKGLIQPDVSLKSSAFKAIGILPLESSEIQAGLVSVYKQWAIPDKNRFLQSASSLRMLHKKLYETLAADLEQNNAWFLSSLIPVLAVAKVQAPEVIEKIKKLEKSGNAQLENAARKFLEVTRSAQ